MRILFIAFALLIAASGVENAFSQDVKRDKGKLIEYENEFWDAIKESAEKFREKEDETKKSFKMDFSGCVLPKSKDEFTTYWHNDPISQGWTGTCWCFAATSYLESEIARLKNKKIKLSELYAVYWEYVEKARRFIREQGESYFSEGSQTNAVLRIWKDYGCVPASAYTGMLEGQEFHDHSVMFAKMKTYLDFVKTNEAWNEEENLAVIKTIMNKYLGEPPSKFQYEGKTYTPAQFRDQVVGLDLDAYVDVMSILELPYYEVVEYEAPDNWWKAKVYRNVPLEGFMSNLIEVVKNGNTVVIGGDVSSSGYDSHAEVAMVPSYDIPSEYIDEYARQLRWSNGTTTDDHAIHIVGYKEMGGELWFLIKDSGSGSRNGANKGYYFYHSDYVKLKMMNFMTHKDNIKDLLNKFDK